ncbi:MAG: DUF429 domain-containing protein [Caldimonas sp.]
MRLAGIDFTCAPSRRKPVTVAEGRLAGDTLRLDDLRALTTLADFDRWLATPGAWLAAFDFPFGLPREFVDGNGLGASCDEVIAEVHARCPDRMAWRRFIDAWGNGRTAGTRLLHRRTDGATAVRSTSPLQSRYVPVAFMYYEGLSRLVAAGVTIPGLRTGDPGRVALEGYPRRLAHAVVGGRSYKNRQAPDREAARLDIVRELEAGSQRFGVALSLDEANREAILADASGDRLDAVLCLVQAAIAARLPAFGLPADIDRVEGWIAG